MRGFQVYYQRNGEPYPGDEETQAAAVSHDFTDENKVVKQETLPNGVRVSTVWVGLDRSYGHGPPLIFETVALRSEGDPFCVDQRFYPTQDKALAGHDELVEKWRKARKPQKAKGG